MEKLPISIGILSWKSGQTLVNTLTTYHNNGLFNCVNDVCILFQEYSDQDKQIFEHFNLSYIAKENNIGIGKAFIELTNQSKTVSKCDRSRSSGKIIPIRIKYVCS